MGIVSQLAKQRSLRMLADLGKTNVTITTNAGAPTDGTSGTGAGTAGPGSLCFDTVAKVWYTNTGTKASPTWSALGLQTT